MIEFIILFLLFLLIGSGVYVGFTRSKYGKKHLCYGNGKQLYNCGNGNMVCTNNTDTENICNNINNKKFDFLYDDKCTDTENTCNNIHKEQFKFSFKCEDIKDIKDRSICDNCKIKDSNTESCCAMCSDSKNLWNKTFPNAKCLKEDRKKNVNNCIKKTCVDICKEDDTYKK